MAQLNLELCFRVAFLAVLLPLASGACVDLDLGVGKRTIPDSDIAASSEQNASTPAKNGRLNYTLGSSWCAGTTDTNPYLQIDLQTLHIICAVSIQGNSKGDQWVKNYTLQLSTNGTTWTDYMEGGQTKFLRGNDDRNSEVKHVVYGVLTKHLRLLPQTYQGGVCMRTEVFGVKQKPTCETEAIGLAIGGKIPDNSFTALSHFADIYKPSKARLGGSPRGWGPEEENTAGDYLQIDLLYEYVICAVATQGAGDINEWTTKYKIRLSLNGTTFVIYKEDNVERVFQGNSNKDGIKTNSFKDFSVARIMRLEPTAYNVWKVLRVEVYGVLLTKVPSQPPTAFKLTASSSTSIIASWKLPPVFARHGTIVGFKLFYTKKGSGGSATSLTISSGSTLNRNVTGLEKYTEYEFQVLAFTSDGDGAKSPVEVEITKEDVPSKAPSSFTVAAVTSKIITASWQLPPPDSRNGIIIGFKLFYKKKGSAGSVTTLTINNGTASSFYVTGLDKNTEYELQILAFTTVGDGQKSSPAVVARTMKDGCVEFNLGMEGGTIPDTRINASSVQSGSTPAKNGRLNHMSGSSWCAGTSDPNPYLQIDLKTPHIICAVSTQGNFQEDQWVRNYTIQLSKDGTTWTDYEEGGQVKVLIGNDDRNSQVKHVVYGVLTRYLRFLPQTHLGGVCMRTEVFGVKQKPICEIEAIGLAMGGKIPDSSFTASSHFVNDKYKPSKGRLRGGPRGWGPEKKNTAGDYLQIDLLYEYVICAVATQGAGEINEWTTKYKIQLSFNSTSFVTYKEDNVDRVFQGNSDKNGIVNNSLEDFSIARIMRFEPTAYKSWKVLRVEAYGVLLTKVPSQPPTAFKLTASSSTSITVSWQLPPVFARHGTITGFKLFYKKKGFGGSTTTVTISSGSTLSRNITGLDKYTEYEFHVLAFTSNGDGAKSPVEVKRTMEDAPSAPTPLSSVDVPPSNLHGPRITLTWSKPTEPNGVIRGYTLFYSHDEGGPEEYSGLDKDALNHTVDVLGGVTYQFHVRAVTTKPGPNETINVTTKEYAPSVGPEPASLFQVHKTTYNISWEPLPKEKSYGKVTSYEVKTIFLKKGNLRKRSVINSPSVNTSATFVVLSDFELCSKYDISVRAYTAAGPGPYGKPSELETSSPEAPGDFSVTDSGTAQVTLTWKKYDQEEKIEYTVKYTGTKDYDKTFKDDEKLIESIKTTTQTVTELIPGTKYAFEVYSTSVCGKSISKRVFTETDMIAPKTPVPHNMTDVEISETAVNIILWPVEQKFGPISAYQVIVLKVVDGVEKLPENYDSQLKAASDAKKGDVNFYIAAEIKNVPVLEKPWKFTVGGKEKTKIFVNEELEKGQNYIVYQRALTDTTKEVLKGGVEKVAKITITPTITGGGTKEKSSGFNAVAVAVPVVLLLLLVPAVAVAVFFYRRRRQSRSKGASERSVRFGDLKNDDENLTASTSDLVYQNVGDIRQSVKGVEQQPVSEEEEAVYSEADDGKPKPIPVADFTEYWKKNSENGAIVLREEYKNLPGGLQFSWEIGKSNRGKNRYGNIVSYDHSRVELEEIEGDKNSSYINASYIPTYDEVTVTYIATQGPTSTTIADFWRMVWQESCSTIVMLTNLVELGKNKCDQYWPDDTSKYGAIRVTLQKTETFADYVIRSFTVTKDSEKREVQQFHYVTWPDKGVPHHSTALLGFRQKIHARHQATSGPLLVHCSAGVGRTGTYIAIDAMLEGAEKIKTVFIQNYVQVMRRSRPHMVQKDEQYVFLHQAVMEALVGGNTEIESHDLRVELNKLAMVHKSSKKTGYEREFKRLELVTDIQASQEEAEEAFMPANVAKNRFPNIVPLDNARVLLQASSREESYINASFVDDYRQRNAYILTQAPLDNTIIDFWQMISQYDIGTVVMLNNLKEGKQRYPQYWPSEGSAKYGEITVQLLSQETSSNITTRRFSAENSALSMRTSTLQHIQYTGWANRNSCPEPQEILDLMTALQQSQQQSGNGVIVFQCSDGTGRSGCVAAIMSVIERVKIEQTVDVFQTVKLLRAKRPGAVNTLEQYMFCYKTVLAYLDSFSTYSNFAQC